MQPQQPQQSSTSLVFMGLSFIFALSAMLVGLVMITASFFSAAPFFQGIVTFSLGLIIFIGVSLAHIVSKIAISQTILADAMAKYIQAQLMKDAISSNQGGQDIFNMFGIKGFGGMQHPTSISIQKIDEDGNAEHIINNQEINSPEDFKRIRDEIIAKAFGKKAINRNDIYSLSIEELEVAETKAVKEQNFELAANIRDLIKEKTNKKE